MPAPIIPIIVLGGAFLFSKKKKKKKSPMSIGPGGIENDSEVFSGDGIPDVIISEVGKKFTIILNSYDKNKKWFLSASPPDNSIQTLSVYHKWDPVLYKATFNFKGQKKGEGSLVFHLRPVNGSIQEPPLEIVEIQTKIV